MDYAEYGGVPLLGVRGASIICHGGSSARAIKNAVRVTIDFLQNRVNDRIHDEIARLTVREPRASVEDSAPLRAGD